MYTIKNANEFPIDSIEQYQRRMNLIRWWVVSPDGDSRIGFPSKEQAEATAAKWNEEGEEGEVAE